MRPLDYVGLGATGLLLFISVYTDIRYRKIYNAVTVPFALIGLGLGLYTRGLSGLLLSLAGLGLGLAVFFLSAFLGRILGAGDCKLFAAVGAIQGPQMLVWCILYSLLAGGLIAVVVALCRGVLQQAFSRVWRSLYFRAFHKMPMDITEAGEKMRLPYALAIAVGSAVAIWQYHGRW